MRLICPNCSAQYEIDASLIPDEGRDVQCSNCGHTWYELPPPPAAGTVNPPEEIAAAVPEAATAPEPEPELEPEPEIEAAPEPEAEPEPEMPAAARAADDEDVDEAWDWPKTRMVPKVEAPEPPAAPAPQRPRRPADVAALDVLREEAEREIGRRRAEAPVTIETQQEMGLATPTLRESPSRALRARMARLRGEDEEETQARAAPKEDDGYRAPRRDLLPDIEEINSTLRPGARDTGDRVRSPEAAARHRNGFRLGFVASVGIAALLILAYAWAPGISAALPAAEPALIAYVDMANAARDALDALIGQAGS